VPRKLQPASAAAACSHAAPLGGPHGLGAAAFRLLLNADLCATTKLAEGLQAFVDDTNKLEGAVREKVREKAPGKS
jgi:transaldolase